MDAALHPTPGWNESERQQVELQACFLGLRLDVRELERLDAVVASPLTLRTGADGFVVLFRYGVVVFINVTEEERVAFTKSVTAYVEGAFDAPETETLLVICDERGDERIRPDGALRLRDISLDRLHIVANILGKSAVLAHYEERIAVTFDEIERLANELRRGSGLAATRSELLQQIGSALNAQIQTVGRVEVTEKPELTWERPDLDQLYERLSVEYELRDRDRALTRKLDFISQTAETYLDLLQTRQGLRLEWYIILLIVLEIGLSLYGIFFSS